MPISFSNNKRKFPTQVSRQQEEILLSLSPVNEDGCFQLVEPDTCLEYCCVVLEKHLVTFIQL
ncbi:hypothetical protein J6590_086484 [Homalodisca vitripennis]|nr:hypothetical protein J6590_086484 [Homalodisca vitripennis]